MVLLRVIVLLAQGDGRHPVLHVRPLELAAVPLRPTDGHRLEGDDPLGAGELRRRGRLGWSSAIGRRVCWGFPAPWSMAVVGWPVLLISWLVITVFDPTGRRPMSATCRTTAQRTSMKPDDPKHHVGERAATGPSGPVVSLAVPSRADHDAAPSVPPQEDGPIARRSDTRFPIR